MEITMDDGVMVIEESFENEIEFVPYPTYDEDLEDYDGLEDYDSLATSLELDAQVATSSKFNEIKANLELDAVLQRSQSERSLEQAIQNL